MVFTKRMKSARMNQSCCYMGTSSAGRVGRSVALNKVIKTRTYIGNNVDTSTLVVTCSIILPIEEEDQNVDTMLTFNLGKTPTFKLSVTLNGSTDFDGSEDLNTDYIPITIISKTSDNIIFKIDSDNLSEHPATFTLNYNDNNEITDFGLIDGNGSGFVGILSLACGFDSPTTNDDSEP